MVISALFSKRQIPSAKPGMAARRLAVNALEAVLKRKQPFDDSFVRLSECEAFSALEARDKAFARAIAMAALRHAGQIRAILAQFMTKPPASPKGAFDAIMQAACAQLLFLKAPPHAVIDLTVDMVKQDNEARRYSRLANAVLRRVANEGPALAAAQDAEQLNTPDWLWQCWVEAYGEENVRRIATQHMSEPPLDLTVKSDATGWAQKLGGIVLPSGSVRLVHKGRIEEIEGYEAGEWWVQDAAAALPAKLFGAVEGQHIADLCAAPGGKTAQLAAAGAQVTAVDISKSRLKRLQENLTRLQLHAELVEADAILWQPECLFDGVLLDAPCSATGTIRRNPDIAHLKTVEDVEALANTQARLLDHAVTLLKPGGTLIYCTCSLQPEEGEEQVKGALARHPAISLSPIGEAEISGHEEWITEEGFLRTLPCFMQISDPDLSGIDGFFAARLIKAKEGVR